MAETGWAKISTWTSAKVVIAMRTNQPIVNNMAGSTPGKRPKKPV